MERLFGELIAIRLLLGRVLANQAHASGNTPGSAQEYLQDQLDQSIKDLSSVNISTKEPEQEEAIRKMAELTLRDIITRISFSN